MRSTIRLLVALAALLAARPTLALPAGAPIVAVFEIEDQTRALSAAAVQLLTSYLSTKLAEGGVFRLVPSADLKERLTKVKVDALKKGCYEEKCQIELGRELAAQKTLSTRIVQLDRQCVVMSTLFDLKTAASERSSAEKSGCKQDELVGAIDRVAAALRHQGSANPAATKKGGLLIKSTPSGASISLDGQRAQGTTPTILSDLDAGEHAIELRQGDYRHAGKVSVSPDRILVVVLQLRKARARVEIKSDPPGAEVTLAGRGAGSTPLVLPDVEAGSYEVELRKKGFVTERRALRVSAARPSEALSVSLQRAGTIRVASRPEGATVLIDGKAIGKSPLAVPVTPGGHRVMVELKDRVPALRVVRAIVDETTEVAVKLELTEEAKQWVLEGKLKVEDDDLPRRKRSKAWLATLVTSTLLVAGAEAMAVAFTIKANQHYQDTPPFNDDRKLVVTGHALAGGLAAVAVTSLVFYLRSGRIPDRPVTSAARRGAILQF